MPTELSFLKIAKRLMAVNSLHSPESARAFNFSNYVMLLQPELNA